MLHLLNSGINTSGMNKIFLKAQRCLADSKSLASAAVSIIFSYLIILAVEPIKIRTNSESFESGRYKIDRFESVNSYYLHSRYSYVGLIGSLARELYII